MCGFLVIASRRDAPVPHTDDEIVRLRDTLTHRGPDAGRTWTDPDRRVVLAHRRLRVIDPEGGGQPMAHPETGVRLVYNGEIYNFRELRSELGLRGHRFRGRGDTEVLLHAWIEWGESCVERLEGIFAFVVWDPRDRSLFLARDPLGVKPLYHGCFDGLFYAASEAKAIARDRRLHLEVDPVALDLFFHHAYVPAPRSIWRGLGKLPAAHALRVVLDGEPAHEPGPRRYWEIPFGRVEPFAASEEEVLEGLDAVLAEAVARQTVSDVPLGAFLSGGIDSSLVALYLARASAGPVRTFTVGLEGSDVDERPWAARLAERIGARHTEVTVGSGAMDELPHLASLYDEPFADPAAVPTAVLSRRAREEVTVVLSGDGGDETHAGYPRYKRMRQLRWLDLVPLKTRRVLLSPLRGWTASFHRRGPVEQAGRDRVDRYDALTRCLAWTHRRQAYSRTFLDRLGWAGDPEPATGAADWRRSLADRLPGTSGTLDRFQALDLATALPEQLMVKVDRASMAASLEARVPLLDLRAVEFAARVPEALRMKDGRPKYLLRTLLARTMGEAFTDRRKRGFRVPRRAWVRDRRRDLDEELRPGGIEEWLDLEALERMLGAPRGDELVWPFLVFAHWFRAFAGD